MNPMAIARALIVALILGLCVPAHAEVHGVLRVVKGNVQIKSGSTGTVSRARLGQEVYPQDTIITGKDARAKIVMIDNNELNISPESQIEIKNYEYNPAQNKKDVLLNVLYGKVRSKVEQKYDGKTSKFQVKTPSAVAGVRGTDFVTSYNATTHQSQVVTFRGAVQFGLPGANGSILNSVSVTPGKMAKVDHAGAAPTRPVSLPKAEYAKFDRTTKVEADSGKTLDKDHRTPAGENKSSNGSGTSSSNVGSDNSRGVASVGVENNGSMISHDDLATSGNGGAAVPDLPKPPPPPPQPPHPPGPPPVQQCGFCNQLIPSTKPRLNVHVNP